MKVSCTFNFMSRFSFKKRLLSFKFAFKGLFHLFNNEQNTWIHSAIALVTILGGVIFKISQMEWVAVVLSIGIVLAAEAFNTAIEEIANFIQPDQDQRIKIIKDLAAGGVLLTAISALTIGLIIFLPKFIDLFGSQTL